MGRLDARREKTSIHLVLEGGGGLNGGGFKLEPPPLQVSRALFDPRLDFTMSGRGLATG